MKRARLVVAWSVPLTFVGVLVGAAARDRTLDPTVAGGLVALLGAIVAGVYGAAGKDDKDADDG